MRTRRLSILPILALAVSCSAHVNPQPGADSSAVVHAQLKLGETVTSLQGAAVAVDFFDQAGIEPYLGRFFIEGDRGSRGSVIVLSHHLWTERFGAAPSAIGRTVDLDGRSATIVGVAPSAFDVPSGTDVWISK